MGLRALGLQDEQRCAIASGTRLDWVLADLGILCSGGATTTIYPSTTPDDTTYILNDSGSVFVFAENQEQLEKLRAQRRHLSGVKKVIVFASRNGGRYRRVGKTKSNSLLFHPRRGGHYSFFSIAVDKDGNREGPPARPDAKRKI
jgi:long-subunit acyl-CoA synthetase (AMP-forming)